MSRLIKTRAIVIRHTPTSETSRIVQWLTRDHGRVTAIAKGSHRPRNPLLGQIDNYYSCELIYYARDREDAIYITREVAALKTRPRLRRDWRAAVTAHYITGLTARTAPSGEPVQDLFDLLEDALDELDRYGWYAPLLHVFELRLLNLLGLSPRLTGCAACRRPLRTGESAVFSSRLGGLVCRACSASGPQDFPVGPDIAAIMNLWQRADSWSAGRTARCTDKQLASIRGLIGDFFSYHLDLFPAGRNEVCDLTTRPAALRAGRNSA